MQLVPPPITADSSVCLLAQSLGRLLVRPPLNHRLLVAIPVLVHMVYGQNGDRSKRQHRNSDRNGYILNGYIQNGDKPKQHL